MTHLAVKSKDLLDLCYLVVILAKSNPIIFSHTFFPAIDGLTFRLKIVSDALYSSRVPVCRLHRNGPSRAACKPASHEAIDDEHT